MVEDEELEKAFAAIEVIREAYLSGKQITSVSKALQALEVLKMELAKAIPGQKRR